MAEGSSRLSPLGRRVSELLSNGRREEAALVALDEFFKVPRFKPNSRQQQILDTAESSKIHVDGLDISIYVWNPRSRPATPPTVLVTHGFGASAAFLTPLISHLQSSTNFRIVAVDQGGHGNSSGDAASLGHFVQTLRALAEDPQNQPLAGIVCHSVGGIAAIMLLAESPQLLQNGTLVCINPSLQSKTLIVPFCRGHGVPTSLLDDLMERFNPAPEVVLRERLGAKLQRVRVMLIQDLDDPVARPRDTEELAKHILQSDSELRVENTRGLGHFKVIGDRRVSTLTSEALDGRVNVARM